MSRFKKAVWAPGGNRMIVETGHKTFDRQTNCISPGNITANTMTGWACRAWNTPANPFGEPCRPGEMQHYDVRIWPEQVRQMCQKLFDTRDGWVYEFFHYNRPDNSYRRMGRATKIVHGYIFADHDDKYLDYLCTGPTYKSESLLAEMQKYVCRKEEE